MLITFCPQMYHLLWIKFFLISAHLPTLSKKPITGVGVKSNYLQPTNLSSRVSCNDAVTLLKAFGNYRTGSYHRMVPQLNPW